MSEVEAAGVQELGKHLDGYGDARPGAVEVLLAVGDRHSAVADRPRAAWIVASIASLLITTEAMVAETPEKKGRYAGGGMPDIAGMDF